MPMRDIHDSWSEFLESISPLKLSKSLLSSDSERDNEYARLELPSCTLLYYVGVILAAYWLRVEMGMPMCDGLKLSSRMGILTIDLMRRKLR